MASTSDSDHIHKSRDPLSGEDFSPPRTQTTASWLKESLLGLPRRLISSSSPTREKEEVKVYETELQVVGGSEWLVIGSEDSPDMSSSVATASAQESPLTPNSFRKRTNTGGNKPQLSAPPMGPRVNSVSGKNSRTPTPGSPHSTGTGPFQRKPSGRGSRLEVQNGDSMKRSVSPSRVRSSSPSRGGGRINSPNISSQRSSIKKKGILMNDTSDSSIASQANHVVTAPQSESRPGVQSSGKRPGVHSNGNQAAAPQANGKLSQVAPAATSGQASGKNQASISAVEKALEDDGISTSAFEKVRDTLRISRPKKKKKKGKLAYSIVVDPTQMSTPEINLHEPGKYQDPFETSYAENGDMEKKMDHIFKPASIPHNKPEYCDHCGDMAWGLYRQVLKCSSELGRDGKGRGLSFGTWWPGCDH